MKGLSVQHLYYHCSILAGLDLPVNQKSQPATPTSTAQPTDDLKATVQQDVYYANCTAVREADKALLHRGDPGNSKKLDWDGDGVACETLMDINPKIVYD